MIREAAERKKQGLPLPGSVHPETLGVPGGPPMGHIRPPLVGGPPGLPDLPPTQGPAGEGPPVTMGLITCEGISAVLTAAGFRVRDVRVGEVCLLVRLKAGRE